MPSCGLNSQVKCTAGLFLGDPGNPLVLLGRLDQDFLETNSARLLNCSPGPCHDKGCIIRSLGQAGVEAG
jgi:hypothetical protein